MAGPGRRMALVLPDRDRGLEGVDEVAGGLEGRRPVGGRDADDHGEVTHPQVADAMDSRDGQDVVAGGDDAAHVLHGGEGARVRGVAEPADLLGVVVVADPAEEEHLAATAGVGDRGQDGVDAERLG